MFTAIVFIVDFYDAFNVDVKAKKINFYVGYQVVDNNVIPKCNEIHRCFYQVIKALLGLSSIFGKTNKNNFSYQCIAIES